MTITPVLAQSDPNETIVKRDHEALQKSVGDIIADRYRIVKVLGSGGHGTVYLVEQVFLKQLFALKLLNTATASEVAMRRFLFEAKAASDLAHPNIVRAVDCGVINGKHPFIILNYIVGESLERHLSLCGAMSAIEAINVVINLCGALDYAHFNGVVHRDVKPANILLSKNSNVNEVPMLTDFGIAKVRSTLNAESQALTRTGEIFGTPLYMSRSNAPARESTVVLISIHLVVFFLRC